MAKQEAESRANLDDSTSVRPSCSRRRTGNPNVDAVGFSTYSTMPSNRSVTSPSMNRRPPPTGNEKSEWPVKRSPPHRLRATTGASCHPSRMECCTSLTGEGLIGVARSARPLVVEARCPKSPSNSQWRVEEHTDATADAKSVLHPPRRVGACELTEAADLDVSAALRGEPRRKRDACNDLPSTDVVDALNLPIEEMVKKKMTGSATTTSYHTGQRPRRTAARPTHEHACTVNVIAPMNAKHPSARMRSF